jgi:hypothetical protein
LLEQAEATNIIERVLDFQIQAPITPEEFWLLRTETSDTLRETIARLSAEQLQRVALEVQEAVHEFFLKEQMSLPAQAIIVTGERQE